jgi:glyoxylase-like metal-dependent hydrolase (beta-lactamase superfamily II)
MWDVPVYAHELELPFLRGRQAYPEPDPTVEEGVLAKISSIYPNDPINLNTRVRALPDDGSVPGMAGWRWIHPPGHSPGHISLFRDADRTMIAGDTFGTVRQDSLYTVLIQEPEINRPPRYFTPNWEVAWNSGRTLKSLHPTAAMMGHRIPLFGTSLSKGLERLACEFDTLAIPEKGRFVDREH